MLVRFVALAIACSAGTAMAQAGGGPCFQTNYDGERRVLTVRDPGARLVNEQCFITVVPKGARAGAHALPEGRYVITLSAGGEGGAGGSPSEGGRGGTAAPIERVPTELMPGTYRVTLGTGGRGGVGCADPASAAGQPGNPTSVSDGYTGQTIAGAARAEYWQGSGPVDAAVAEEPVEDTLASQGGSRAPAPHAGEGGSGGSARGSARGHDGGASAQSSASPGQGGLPDRLRYAGGGGGAGYGSGGDGASPADRRTASAGDLGGGGGGGHGGADCSDGAPGGAGFVTLTRLP